MTLRINRNPIVSTPNSYIATGGCASSVHTITASECSMVIRTGLVSLDPVVSHKVAPHCMLVDTIPGPRNLE